MAYRLLKNIEEKMIAAITEIGAKEGVKAVTAVKVAAKCDISSFTVFEHFKTKRGFLDAAAQAFDRKNMAFTAKMLSEGKDFIEVWDIMQDFFLSDPDGTLFYISYTSEFGFDPTTNNARGEEFLQVARVLFPKKTHLDDDQMLELWDYVTSMAFYYAEKIIHGYIANTPEVKAYVKRLVCEGVVNI